MLVDFLSLFTILFLFLTCVSMHMITHTLMLVPLLSLYSLLSVLFFILHGAFDVALTEASVGVFLSSFIIFVVLSSIKSENKEMRYCLEFQHKQYILLLLILVLPLCVIFALSAQWTINSTLINTEEKAELRDMRSYDGQTLLDLSRSKLYFMNNPVTAILVYFRGFDTLGEMFVILISCLGMLSVIRSGVKDSSHDFI